MKDAPPSPVTTIDARLSEKLAGISFVSACFVVVLHSYLNYMPEAGGATAWLVVFAGWLLPTFAVPLFFAISGYLLGVKSANGRTDGWYGKAVKKRIRTLLVPYFLWCTLLAATVLPFTMLGNHLASRPLTDNTGLTEPLVSAWNLVLVYGLDLRSPPYDVPMWYNRNLFLLVLLSPAVLAITERRRLGLVYLAATGALFLVQDWFLDCWGQFFRTGFSFSALFFFPLGLYLARHPLPPGAFRRTRAALPLLWLGTCLLYVFLRLHAGENWVAAKFLLSKAAAMLGVGGMWELYDRFPGCKRIARLPVAKDAFFMYACHMGILFTVTCGRVQDLLMARLHVPVAGIFLVRIAAGLGLSLALAEGVKRWFPRAYALLTGGR